MPDPATPAAPEGTPGAPDPKATPKGTEGPGGEGPAAHAPDPELEKLKQRTADQQAQLSREQGARGQLERNNADLHAELERLRGSGTPNGATPKPNAISTALDNLDGDGLGDAVDTKIRDALMKFVPQIQKGATDIARVDRAMEGVREINPETTPEALANAHRTATPAQLAYLDILQRKGQGGLEEALAAEREARESKAAAAKLLGTMADGISKGQRLDQVLNLSPPGEGVDEDEAPNFMHEMGKAKHARKVTKNAQWVDDEHSSQHS